ncbi:MAG TPA: glycosyltransferase family 4 protein [Anaerolineales bacterium]|nr:glycosyltransferase family 4 protein [Anaerolineales bacterium]
MSRRIRILVFAHAADMSGANQVVHALVTQLDPNRFEPEVAVPCEGLLAEALRTLGAGVEVIGETDGYPAALIPVIRRAIVRRNPDLVHINSFSGSSRNVCIASILAGRPYVWHIHEMLPPNTPLKTRFFLRTARRVIACSEASRAQFAALVPRSRPVDLVYNAVPVPAGPVTPETKTAARARLLAEFGLPPDTRVVITVGRVEPEKGQDLLLEAAAAVVRAVPGAVFLVVGPLGGEGDPYLHSLETAIDRLGLEGRVIFSGYRPDAGDLVLGADVMAHPSRKESFGLVLGEALARLTPVVAFRVGGVPEIVRHGRSGWLVEPFDTGELAHRIAGLLSDSDLRTAMGAAGRKDVLASFTVEAFAAKMEKILEGAAGGRSGAGH